MKTNEGMKNILCPIHIDMHMFAFYLSFVNILLSKANRCL